MLHELGIPSPSTEAVLAVVWSLCCFVAGVAYAAYRAVGWVERMRAWAHSVEVDS